MKILLLGEFSSFHKNLKEGLVSLGHEVVVAGSGDCFKKIPVDISFDFKSPFKNKILRKIHNRFQYAFAILKFKNYDVVQIINPFIFPNKLFPRKYIINKLIKNNGKTFLVAAGDDSYFWKYGRNLLKYGPFDDFLKYDLKRDVSSYESKESYSFNKWLVEKCNGVIPIMYEYEISYSESVQRLNTLPIPMNLNKIIYKDNIVSDKLVIFHGLNRYGFKGTRHVEVAFKYLLEKYPDQLECVIEGNLPLNEYLEIMERTNVVIDQLYSHSIGVNGVYALAMGKIVMGGAEIESLRSLGVTESPVINLRPNAQSIIKEVEKLMEKRESITSLGLESRKFAENLHGHTKVAKQYVETWSKN